MTLSPLREVRERILMTQADLFGKFGVVATEERFQRIANQCRIILLNLVDDLEAGRDRKCQHCGGKVELIGGVVLHECWKGQVA